MVRVENWMDLARTIPEYLLRRPILSPGEAFLIRPPRRLHGWRYQEPAGSPTRRRAQAWRDLLIAPCALREAPAGFGLERLATAFINNPG